MNVIIQGVQGVIDGLNNMAREIPLAGGQMLDKTALNTKAKMMSEAPYKTGALSGSVTVSAPNNFTREIYPTAQNFQPGNPYGLPVETGSRAGYVPNVTSIGQYFGVDKKVAWAIALSIKQSGTPANPFVHRTYQWVLGYLPSQLSALAMQVVRPFGKGGRA